MNKLQYTITPTYTYFGKDYRWHVMRCTAGYAQSIACLPTEEKAQAMTNDCNALAHHESVSS